jgi:hypothetical protein
MISQKQELFESKSLTRDPPAAQAAARSFFFFF